MQEALLLVPVPQGIGTVRIGGEASAHRGLGTIVPIPGPDEARRFQRPPRPEKIVQPVPAGVEGGDVQEQSPGTGKEARHGLEQVRHDRRLIHQVGSQDDVDSPPRVRSVVVVVVAAVRAMRVRGRIVPVDGGRSHRPRPRRRRLSPASSVSVGIVQSHVVLQIPHRGGIQIRQGHRFRPSSSRTIAAPQRHGGGQSGNAAPGPQFDDAPSAESSDDGGGRRPSGHDEGRAPDSQSGGILRRIGSERIVGAGYGKFTDQDRLLLAATIVVVLTAVRLLVVHVNVNVHVVVVGAAEKVEFVNDARPRRRPGPGGVDGRRVVEGDVAVRLAPLAFDFLGVDLRPPAQQPLLGRAVVLQQQSDHLGILGREALRQSRSSEIVLLQYVHLFLLLFLLLLLLLLLLQEGLDDRRVAVRRGPMEGRIAGIVRRRPSGSAAEEEEGRR
mmetsp:Transcript_25542/g.75283  ORF Transcript_25542/g.75283 Transcript_25542/m.75283 type:complete len:441 (+) Transcript_25542:399-1721(+)